MIILEKEGFPPIASPAAYYTSTGNTSTTCAPPATENLKLEILFISPFFPQRTIAAPVSKAMVRCGKNGEMKRIRSGDYISFGSVSLWIPSSVIE